MPTTKELHKAWNEHWPINWKLPSYHVLLNSDTIGAKEDQRQMENYMKKAILIMKQYKSHNAAIIVNPKIQKYLNMKL